MRKLIWLLFGLALGAWFLMSRASPLANAAGVLALTETPTSPPTDTATPPSTNTPPPTNTPLPTPTATTIPASTPQTTPVQRDPLITKRVDLAQAVVGDEVRYTLTVLNPGESEIPNVLVTDPLPAQLDFVEGTTTAGTLTYDAAAHTLRVDIGTLAPHQEVTITLRARVNQLGQPTDIVTNLAYVGDTPSNPVDIALVPPGLPGLGFGPGPRERWLLLGMAGLSITACIATGLSLLLWARRRF